MPVSVVLSCLYCMTCYTLRCDWFAPLGSVDHSSKTSYRFRNEKSADRKNRHYELPIKLGAC